MHTNRDILGKYAHLYVKFINYEWIKGGLKVKIKRLITVMHYRKKIIYM